MALRFPVLLASGTQFSHFQRKQETATYLAFRPADGDLHDTLSGADFMSVGVTIPQIPRDVKSPEFLAPAG